MYKLVLLLLVLLNCSSHISQIAFLKAPYDMGVISASSNDYLDIQIKNVSKEKVYIFRTDVDKRFVIHYSSKTILPDSTIFMRVLFTPDKKGSFKESLAIHFSCYDQPKKIDFTGFTESIPPNGAIDCPSFDQQNIVSNTESDYIIRVINAKTGEILPNSEVQIIKNGFPLEIANTKNKGIITRKMQWGYYYFVANKEGYYQNELASYVNRKTSEIVIPLNQSETQVEEIILAKEETTTIKDTAKIEVSETELSIPIEVVNLPDEIKSDFSLRDFRPNNIVLLVDVSSSMNQSGKLDLLKASMISLTSMLRPQDKITLVSYATNAKVIIPTTAAIEIDTLIATIQALEAKGITAGGKGMALAYSSACDAFITNGNNQIIMATDGVFNSGDENVNKLAKKYSKKGVKISVIGIKNKEVHIPMMQQLATYGKGRYTNIENYDQAKKSLVDEIKIQSRILP